MGCTSSAPNMNTTTTAEKSIQFEEDFLSDQSNDVEEILYRADNTDKTNVLPLCDNLVETLKLDRYTSTTNLVKQDEPEQHNFGDTSNKSSNTDGPHNTIEDLASLYKVVEIVVENMHKTENVDDTPVQPEPIEIEEKPEVQVEITDVKSEAPHEAVETTENGDDDAETTEQPTELASPTQSESSRATRWEALADIAAELPPSLMVDPITGQIYALSK